MTRPALLASVAAIALSLAACNKPTQTASNAAPAAPDSAALPALPMTSGPAQTLAPAPAADALPQAVPAPFVRVANPEDQYAYLDQAYYESDALETAPPDYGFGYDGADAWAWQGDDSSREIVEPVGNGYRHYYYRPGSAYPYLVSDPDYSYGFNGPNLAVVYDAHGAVIPYDNARADYAGRYLARAQALYRASEARDRRAVNATTWAADQARVQAQRNQWNAERSRQAAWNAYDSAHRSQETAHWSSDRDQRRQSADHFNQWRQTGFQGPPPAPPVQRRDERAAANAQQDQARQREDQQRQAEANRQAQARQTADQQHQADLARQSEANRQAQMKNKPGADGRRNPPAQPPGRGLADQQHDQAIRAQQARQEAQKAQADHAKPQVPAPPRTNPGPQAPHPEDGRGPGRGRQDRGPEAQQRQQLPKAPPPQAQIHRAQPAPAPKPKEPPKAPPPRPVPPQANKAHPILGGPAAQAVQHNNAAKQAQAEKDKAQADKDKKPG